MIAVAHRHGDDRARLHLRLFVDLGEKPRVLAHVRHDHGFVVLRHPAGNSLPHLDAHVLQRLRALAHGQLEIQFLLRLIDKQQRPGVRPQKLVDFFHDGAQDLIELQGGSEGLAKLVENRDLARFAMFSSSARAAAPVDPRKILSRIHLMPSCRILIAGHPPFHGRCWGTRNYSQLAPAGATPTSHPVA